MRLQLVVLSLLVSAVSIGRADEDSEKVLKALQGEWKVDSIVSRGEAIPAQQLEKLTFTFKGNEVIPSDMPKDVATVTLDPSKKPAWFDITDRSKETLLGIYELNGDSLKFCSAADPKAPRSKEFAATKENMATLIVLKRVKK
jgi:uncharacterized protein (TIGR03067 family)